MKSTSKERLSFHPVTLFKMLDDYCANYEGFQNLRRVFLGKDKNYHDKFKELFKLRHDTIHTVMPLKEDITEYYEITENMMMHVLDKTDRGDEYFVSVHVVPRKTRNVIKTHQVRA